MVSHKKNIKIDCRFVADKIQTIKSEKINYDIFHEIEFAKKHLVPKSDISDFQIKYLSEYVLKMQNLFNEHLLNVNKLKYEDYLNTFWWYRRRIIALEKAENKCQICGFGYELHVHHVSYKNKGNEKDEDLFVCCHRCHNDIHVKTERQKHEI